MTTRNRKEQNFEDLADALVDDLLVAIRAGTASSADKALARQLLNDAGIRINPADLKDNQEILKNLPFKDPEFEDEPQDESPIPFSPSIKEKKAK